MKKDSLQISAAEKFITDNNLLIPSDRVLLSMSAGKDSMFLFHLFLHIRKTSGIEFAVMHLNHLARGTESDLDEKFISAAAEKNSVTVYSFSHDFSGDTGRSASFEERAREKRYSLLKKIAAEHGYTKIATGHSADDNIETIIMRIFSGTGLHGLKGIAPSRGMIIRPMLALSSAEIYAYLQQNGIEWREDLSNRDDKYTRNFVRSSIIPPAEKRFPAIRAAVMNLSNTAADSMRMIDEYISLKYMIAADTGDDFYSFDASLLNGDRAAFNHLTAAGIRHAGGYPALNILDEIYRNYSVPKPNSMLYSSVEFQVLKKRYSVLIRRPVLNSRSFWEYEIEPAESEGLIHIPECGAEIHFRIDKYNPDKNYKEQGGSLFIDPRGTAIFKIRSRKPSDRIKLGFGNKKIKDLMIDLKTDPSIRNSIPLLEAENKIAAYMQGIITGSGSRVSDDFLVKSTSKKILAIWGVKKS